MGQVTISDQTQLNTLPKINLDHLDTLTAEELRMVQKYIVLLGQDICTIQAPVRLVATMLLSHGVQGGARAEALLSLAYVCALIKLGKPLLL